MMSLEGKRARSSSCAGLSGPGAKGRAMATQPTSSGLRLAISRQMRKASSGKAPGRSWRETLACSTAEAMCASLMRQQAGSLTNPPRPRMVRDGLDISQALDRPFPADASEDGEDARADGLAGESGAGGVDQQAGFDAALFGQLAEIGFYARFGKFGIGFETIG